MAPLGPFEPRPRIAIAVSGGADSLACALLAATWATARDGGAVGLVVDHALRPDSAAEARLTAERLRSRGIEAHILTVATLPPGPALAERARIARYALLEAACAERGLLHLLLGHHAADQAETIALRLLRRSGPAGLAGMAALSEHRTVRLLRPLLTIPPACLRATLRAAGQAWIDDPSNHTQTATRNRLRLLRADADGAGPATAASLQAAAWRATGRAAAERETATHLGQTLRIHPAGYALLPPEPPPPAALAALLRALTGAPYPPPAAAIAAWCARPRPATLAGIRILRAGRLAPGDWLLVREAAAMEPDRLCRPGVTWDNRHRVLAAPAGLTIGPLGPQAATLRHLSPLPAAILQTLPALRCAGRLFAVPQLGYCEGDGIERIRIVFDPVHPAAGAPFFASAAGDLHRGFAECAPATYLS